MSVVNFMDYTPRLTREQMERMRDFAEPSPRWRIVFPKGDSDKLPAKRATELLNQIRAMEHDRDTLADMTVHALNEVARLRNIILQFIIAGCSTTDDNDRDVCEWCAGRAVEGAGLGYKHTPDCFFDAVDKEFGR